ncbi:hypothetical protein ACLOJK_032189 [Asimina triloba]
MHVPTANIRSRLVSFFRAQMLMNSDDDDADQEQLAVHASDRTLDFLQLTAAASVKWAISGVAGE